VTSIRKQVKARYQTVSDIVKAIRDTPESRNAKPAERLTIRTDSPASLEWSYTGRSWIDIYRGGEKVDTRILRLDFGSPTRLSRLGIRERMHSISAKAQLGKGPVVHTARENREMKEMGMDYWSYVRKIELGSITQTTAPRQS
jgi:hypothetical protein